MRYLSPAGTPIQARDLRRWLGRLPRRHEELESLRAEVTARFELAGCEFVSSGRAGLTLLLRTLYELCGDPQRNEVVIPGYTCFSVPASIERAGLRVRACDIDPRTLSYDLVRLSEFDFSRVLAIVSANLYGLPNDLPKIEALAGRQGVYLVDDAAQAMGATIAGRAVGTFGDIGLFSLDKGKNITSMQGGIVLTRDAEIAAILHRRVAGLPGAGITDTLAQVLKLILYAFLLPPTRYGITRRMPFLGLGRTPYVTPTPLTQYSPALGAFAAILFERLEVLGMARRDTAQRIQAALEDQHGIDLVEPLPDAVPAYVRLPVLAADPGRRDRLLRTLGEAGIGASASYPTAVTDIADLSGRLDPIDLDCPGAQAVARRILTLPTHPFVQPPDIERMAMAFSRVPCDLAEGARSPPNG